MNGYTMILYCPKCHENNIEGMTVGYRCLSCGFNWQSYWSDVK